MRNAGRLKVAVIRESPPTCRDANTLWLSTQTGVAVTTLKRHYAKTHREAQRDAEELGESPCPGEAPEKTKEGAA